MTRILIFAPLFPPAWKGGGPIQSVFAIATSAARSYDVRVLTRDRDLGETKPLPVARNQWVESSTVLTNYVSVRRPSQYLRALWSARLWRPHVLYLNSFFDLEMGIVPQILARLGWWGRPLIAIAPRGEFGAAALSIKSPKKRLYLAIYRLLGMRRHIIWHASSDREGRDIRTVMGVNARFVVRENDTSLPSPDSSEVPVDRSPGPLRAVFVGRLVPIKGIDLLMEALQRVSGEAEIDVFGPFEDPAFVARCQALSMRIPDSLDVRFRGPLDPSDVRRIVSGADLFLMPTRGENFGQVIAEALSCAVPVMVEDVTPWTATIMRGGGVLVPGATPDAWAEAIDRYLMKGPSEWVKARAIAAKAYRDWYGSRPTGTVFDLLTALSD